MKIGILTQSISNNYGGILQNYALQTILIRMGHEVETLNWDSYRCNHENETIVRNIVQIIKTFVSRHFFRRTRNYYWNQRKFFYQLSTNNQLFIQQHTKQSEWLWGKTQFRNYTIKKHFDALIVGSDQVWRPLYNKNGMLYRMFLDFSYGLNIKRIAYAASFGVDFWEYNSMQTIKCSKLLQNFDAISTREPSGVKLCQQYFNISNVEWVLDPTLLLNQDDYNSLFQKKYKNSSGRLLTTYILDNSKEKQQLIHGIVKCKKLHVAEFIPQYCNLGTVTPTTINNYKPPSIIKWLQAFHDADYVICDSFHGTALSIIFNKPFIAIANRNRGYGRFTSLLKLFDLEANLVDESIPISHAIEIINNPINWEKINDKRQMLKQQSLHFIENALNQEKP